jgi:hypothetical protein
LYFVCDFLQFLWIIIIVPGNLSGRRHSEAERERKTVIRVAAPGSVPCIASLRFLSAP